jgi:hypothetical protein
VPALSSAPDVEVEFMTAVDNKVVELPRRHHRYADALVNAGHYDARLVDAETAVFFFGKSPRVILWFQITTFGPAFEAVLPAYYAAKLNGKPRRNGKFTIGLKSRLARDLAAMLGRRPPLDYVPIDELVNTMFTINVVTVANDSTQHEIPNGARYSKVERVLGRAEK